MNQELRNHLVLDTTKLSIDFEKNVTWSNKPELLQQPADDGDRRWSIVHVNPSFLESAVPATFTGLFPAESDNKLIKVFYHNGPHSQILSGQNSLINLQDECAAAAATHYNLITKWGKHCKKYPGTG